jgi:hypothetical protein
MLASFARARASIVTVRWPAARRRREGCYSLNLWNGAGLWLRGLGLPGLGPGVAVFFAEPAVVVDGYDAFRLGKGELGGCGGRAGLLELATHRGELLLKLGDLPIDYHSFFLGRVGAELDDVADLKGFHLFAKLLGKTLSLWHEFLLAGWLRLMVCVDVPEGSWRVVVRLVFFVDELVFVVELGEGFGRGDFGSGGDLPESWVEDDFFHRPGRLGGLQGAQMLACVTRGIFIPFSTLAMLVGGSATKDAVGDLQPVEQATRQGCVDLVGGDALEDLVDGGLERGVILD